LRSIEGGFYCTGRSFGAPHEQEMHLWRGHEYRAASVFPVPARLPIGKDQAISRLGSVVYHEVVRPFSDLFGDSQSMNRMKEGRYEETSAGINHR
jgi:hypothetical protein